MMKTLRAYLSVSLRMAGQSTIAAVKHKKLILQSLSAVYPAKRSPPVMLYPT